MLDLRMGPPCLGIVSLGWAMLGTPAPGGSAPRSAAWHSSALSAFLELMGCLFQPRGDYGISCRQGHLERARGGPGYPSTPRVLDHLVCRAQRSEGMKGRGTLEGTPRSPGAGDHSHAPHNATLRR